MAKRKQAADSFVKQPSPKCARMPGKVEPMSRKHDASKQAQMGSRLLSLPGEIRNTIYYFAAEDADLPVTLRPADTPHRSTVKPALAAPPLHRRRFHALTQVCHLIRKEFLATYAAENEIFLHLDDVPRYIQSFFPSEDPAVRAKYLGNIYINSSTCDKPKNQGFDFLFLIKLLIEAPGIQCRISDPRKRDDDRGTNTTVLRLLNNRNSAWLESIATQFESIRLHAHPLTDDNPFRCRWCGGMHRAGRPLPFVQLILKKEHRKPWMDDGGMSSEKRAPLKNAYLENIGLDDWPTNYVVKVEATPRRSARKQAQQPDEPLEVEGSDSENEFELDWLI